ncbi:hypothetical protein AB2N04_08830 [Nitratireductor sp. GISD-1A_MAKvit]|uniref:hypothetical protein n=1 Tax=Nitratireductor sp. GISD-1A_MAKvit TaxID=3234198 RepID=UPI003465A015
MIELEDQDLTAIRLNTDAPAAHDKNHRASVARKFDQVSLLHPFTQAQVSRPGSRMFFKFSSRRSGQFYRSLQKTCSISKKHLPINGIRLDLLHGKDCTLSIRLTH